MSRLFIIIITACTITACSAPIGSIGGGYGSSSRQVDALWAVPYRVEYNLNDLFRPSEDLSVLVLYQGVVQPVSIDDADLSLSIIDNPDFSVTEIPISKEDVGYPLTTTGRKVIVVRYSDLSARYSINVTDPYNLGGSNGGNGDGDGTGIIIEWAQW